MSKILLILPYIICLSFGQILFKKIGIQVNSADNKIVTLLSSPLFYCAAGLYALLTVYWIFILSKTPLSVAYPYVLLSFITTPLAASFVFQEKLGFYFWVGTLVMLTGGVILAFDTFVMKK